MAAGTMVASALGNAPTRSARRSPDDERVHLEVGEVEPRGDRVGVREQQLAGRGGERAGAAADEQRGAELALEGADLLRHRGLAERERLGRARERALARDLAEGEQAARIEHSLSLSVVKIDYLNL